MKGAVARRGQARLGELQLVSRVLELQLVSQSGFGAAVSQSGFGAAQLSIIRQSGSVFPGCRLAGWRLLLPPRAC